jgi:hypothetical protein
MQNPTAHRLRGTIHREDTMRRDHRHISSHLEDIMDLKEDISSRVMDLDIIRNKDRTDLRAATMVGVVDQVGLWRRCWLVWRVVVVWMLVCSFKRLYRRGAGPWNCSEWRDDGEVK